VHFFPDFIYAVIFFFFYILTVEIFLFVHNEQDVLICSVQF